MRDAGDLAVSSAAAAVELRGVSFSYGARRVLEDVSLAFRSGELAAILGPNGCGKSTAVKLMQRALVPARGSVLLGGEDLSGMGRKEVARRVAVLQQGGQVPSMRVEQFVMCGRYPHRPALMPAQACDYDAVRAAMERAGCASHADDDMARLSGGERQRVHLAAVLAQEAGVVVMDEPTTYLDPTACFDLMSMARELASGGAAVVMVLHDIPLALSCCDRVALLADGRVQACGTSDEVAASGAVERVLNVRLRRVEMGEACDARNLGGSAHAAWCLLPARR